MQPTFFPSSCPQVYIHIRFAHIHPYPFNFDLLFYCTSLVPMSILTLNSIFGKYIKKKSMFALILKQIKSQKQFCSLIKKSTKYCKTKGTDQGNFT